MSQGELLASSQAKVVELHITVTQQARKFGITDHQLLIDNARISSELESSVRHCQERDGCVALVLVMLMLPT